MAERIHWPNQWTFILAAVGSAAGLGNLWRFPFLTYEYGGAAFIVAIIIANLLVGIPLLMLEVGIGQKEQKGAPDALASIKKAFRFVGWTALVLGFMVLSYYMAVVAWSLDYLSAAFTLGWGSDASSFFFNDILNLSSGVDVIGGLSWQVLAGLIVAWALVYFCVWKGVESISKVVRWSATLPFVILAILIVRALTLDGAANGLSLYLVPDWGALSNPKLWLAAFSQIFFSLSLAFGIMIAYGSLKEPASDIIKGTVYVAIGNFIVSFMAGLVVFGTLGYMALTQGIPITEVVAGGPSLVFVVFPEAISLLPAFNAVIGVLFFGMLLALAIDSAFSLLEAVATTLRDRFPHVGTKKIAFAIMSVSFVFGLIFTTGAGLYYLDIVDHFIVNYGLVIVGLLEAVALGWFCKSEQFLDFLNKHSEWKLGTYWVYLVQYAIPAALGIFLLWNIINEIKAPYEGYPAWALLYLGVLPLFLAPIVGYILDKLTSEERVAKIR